VHSDERQGNGCRAGSGEIPSQKGVVMSELQELVFGAVILTCAASGCGGEDDGYKRPPGRGSAACQAWQKAICDYIVLDCSAISEKECVENYYGVTCKSDATAQSCAAALANASCNAPPSGCDLFDMADPAPAVAACNAFVDTACQHIVGCSSQTLDACHAEASANLDCSAALAYTPSYETCLSDIPAQACDAPDAPASCEGVIRLNP
jgi:hypothetical protein